MKKKNPQVEYKQACRATEEKLIPQKKDDAGGPHNKARMKLPRPEQAKIEAVFAKKTFTIDTPEVKKYLGKPGV